MKALYTLAVGIAAMIAAPTAQSDEPIYWEMFDKIMDESFANNEVMENASWLTYAQMIFKRERHKLQLEHWRETDRTPNSRCRSSRRLDRLLCLSHRNLDDAGQLFLDR